METQAYFALATFDLLIDTASKEFMDDEKILGRIERLTSEQAATLQEALQHEAASMGPKPSIWLLGETESKKDKARHLYRCRKAREVQEELQTDGDAHAGDLFYDLARRAQSYAEIVRDEDHGTSAEVNGEGQISADRFEVWDQAAGKSVIFQAADCEKWGPVEDIKQKDEDFVPVYWVEMTLYRHPSKDWTLVSQTVHGETGGFGFDAERLSDLDAADWLVRNKFDPPADISHLTENTFFKPGSPIPEAPPTSEKPKWNRDRRELCYKGRICKSYRQKAQNQVRIVEAFEEEGWPERIDDPLPYDGKVDPKERLREAVRALNRSGIRFELDGTGEGVIWSPADGEKTDDIPF